MTIELYEVGGCVRDGLLGIESKDIDFTVVAPSYNAMKYFLIDTGFTIFLESPEYFTIRARFPGLVVDDCIPVRFAGMRNLPTADFVLARKEGEYTDGRRPDVVEVGTLYDDLSRRDFTVNAIARDKDGNYIDPFGGRLDLERRLLRAVGNAEDRIREDALRALRAIRFGITKGFYLDGDISEVLHSTWLPELIESVSVERRREELDKCFKADTMATLDILQSLPRALTRAIFSGGLRLKPTMEA